LIFNKNLKKYVWFQDMRKIKLFKFMRVQGFMVRRLALSLMRGELNIGMNWFRNGHRQQFFLIRGGC
jgi:hypothetical protein